MEGGELDGEASANSQMEYSFYETPSEVITDDFVFQPRLIPVKVEPPDNEPEDGFHAPMKKEEIITDDVPPQINLAPIPMKLIEAATGKLIQYQPVVENPDDEEGELDPPMTQEPLVLIKQEPDENASEDDECSRELPYCPTELVQTSFGTYDMPEVDISLVRWKWKMRRVLRESATKVNAKKDGLTERQLQKQAEKCSAKGMAKKRKLKRPCRQSDVPDELTSGLHRERPGEMISPSDPKGERDNIDKPRVNRIIISAKKSTRKDGHKIWECYEVDTIDGGTERVAECSGGYEAKLGRGTRAVKSGGGATLAAGGAASGGVLPEAEVAPSGGRRATLRRRTSTPPVEEEEEPVVRRLRSRSSKNEEERKRNPVCDENGYYEELGFKLRRLRICVARMTFKEIENARNDLLVEGRKRRKVSEDSADEEIRAESRTQSSPYFKRKRNRRLLEVSEEKTNVENRRNKRIGDVTAYGTEGELGQGSERLGKTAEMQEEMSEGVHAEGEVLNTRKRKGKLVPVAEDSGSNALDRYRKKKVEWETNAVISRDNTRDEDDQVLGNRSVRRVDSTTPEDEPVDRADSEKNGRITREIPEENKNVADECTEVIGSSGFMGFPTSSSEDEGNERDMSPKTDEGRRRRNEERTAPEVRRNFAEEYDEISDSRFICSVDSRTEGCEESQPRKRPNVDKSRKRRARRKSVSEESDSEDDYQELVTGKRKTKRVEGIYEGSSPVIEVPTSTTNEDIEPDNCTERAETQEVDGGVETLDSGRCECQSSGGQNSAEDSSCYEDQTRGNPSEEGFHDGTPEDNAGEPKKTAEATEEDNIRRLENFCKTVNTDEGAQRETVTAPEEKTQEEAGECSNTTKPTNPRGSRRSRRKDETSEERRERLQKAKEARLNETPEQKRKRLEFLKACQKKYLARETEEQRKTRLEKMKAYQAKRLANETPEQREKRLERARQYVAQHTTKKKTSNKGTNVKLDFEEGRDESTSAYGSEPGKSNEDDDRVEGPAATDKWVTGGESQVGWNYGEHQGGLYNKGVAGTVPAGETMLGAEEYGRGAAVERYVNYSAFVGDGAASRGNSANQSVGEACPNVGMVTDPVQCPGERSEALGAREERLSSDVHNVKRLIVSAMHATDYDSHKAWNDRSYPVARETVPTVQTREEAARSEYFVGRVGSEVNPNAEELLKTKNFGRRGEKPTMMNWGRGYDHQGPGLKTKGMLKDNYYSAPGGRFVHERNVYAEGYPPHIQGSPHGVGDPTALNRSVRVEETFANSGAEGRHMYVEGYAANSQVGLNSVEGTPLNRSAAVGDGFTNRGAEVVGERDMYSIGYAAHRQGIANSAQGQPLSNSAAIGGPYVNRGAEVAGDSNVYGMGYAGSSQGSVHSVVGGAGMSRSAVAEGALGSGGVVAAAEERGVYPGGYTAISHCTVSSGVDTAINRTVAGGVASVNRGVQGSEESVVNIGVKATEEALVNRGVQAAVETSVHRGVQAVAEERSAYNQGYSRGGVNGVAEERAPNKTPEEGFVNREARAFGNVGGQVAGCEAEMAKGGAFEGGGVDRAVLGSQEGLNASDIIEGSADEGECNSDELIRSDVVEWHLDSTGLDAEEFDKSEPSDWESSQESYLSERSRGHTEERSEDRPS